MMTTKPLLLAAVMFLASCTSSVAGSSSAGLRHVVLFKFKDSTTPEQVKAIEDNFRGLPDRVPTITDFEWGTNVSEENKSEGYTHCFLVTFADVAGRAVYLPHAAHKEFVELLLPSLDKVLVIDYAAKQ
jgi:hypothetical protein